MIELLPQLEIQYDQLTLESQKIYDEVVKKAGLSSKQEVNPNSLF